MVRLHKLFTLISICGAETYNSLKKMMHEYSSQLQGHTCLPQQRGAAFFTWPGSAPEWRARTGILAGQREPRETAFPCTSRARRSTARSSLQNTSWNDSRAQEEWNPLAHPLGVAEFCTQVFQLLLPDDVWAEIRSHIWKCVCSYLMRSSGWYLYQTPHQAQHS